MTIMESGIVMLAIGKPIYGKFAFTMAMSIKYHSPDIPIQLIYEEKALSHLTEWHRSFFDIFTPIDLPDMLDDYMFSPCKAKLSIYKYAAFDEFIYLDVDGLLIKPIEGLFEECRVGGGQYYTQVIGKGHRSEELFEDMIWAFPSDIWEHYDLTIDEIPFINSSFHYIRKGDQSRSVYDQAMTNFFNKIPTDKLRATWGKSQPDELYMNIALGQLGIDATTAGKKSYPVYMNNRKVDTETHIAENFYVLGLYGADEHTHGTVRSYYDQVARVYMIKSCPGKGGHCFKASTLMKEKFIIKPA